MRRKRAGGSSAGPEALVRLGAGDQTVSRPSRPVMLLVLGPHRSGTSVVTRLLECLGAGNSSRLIGGDADNPTGYFEDADINTFNDTVLLPRLGLSWHSIGFVDWSRLNKTDRSRLGLQALEIVRRNYPANQPLSVLKEPRIGTLLPFWLSVLTHAGFDVRIVGCVRDPVSVARSLARRDHFSITHGGMLYTTMWLSVLPHLQDLPVALADYDTVCSQPGKVLRAVADKLRLPLPADVEERLHDFTSNHLDLNLRHSRLPAEDVALEPDLPPLAAHLHQALLSAARAQNIKKAARFALASDRIVEAFRPVLADFDQLLAGARAPRPSPETAAAVPPVAAGHAATDAVARERDQLAAQLAEAQVTREELAARLAALHETSARLAAAEQELEKWRAGAGVQQDAAARVEELARVYEELSARHGALLEERGALEEERDRLMARLEETGTRDAEAAARQAALSQTTARLATAEQELEQLRAQAMRAQDAASRVEELERFQEDLSARHRALLEERTALEDERDRLNALLSESRAGQEENKARHALLQSAHDELAARVADSGNLQSELAVRQAAMAETLGKLSAAEQSLAEAKAARDKSEAEAKDKAEENDLLLNQLHQVQEELEKYFLENQDLKKERDTLKSDHSSLATRHASLVAERDALASDHSSLATRHTSLESDHASLVTRHASLESDHSSLLAERDALRAESETALRQRDAMERSLKERFVELGKLTTRVASLHEELLATRAVSRRLEHRLSHAQQRVDDLLASTSWKLTRPLRVIREMTGAGPDGVAAPEPSDYDIIKESGLFDPDYYLRTNPDVASSGMNPLAHYVAKGAAESRNPSADFNTAEYRRKHGLPSDAEKPVNPLVHLIKAREAARTAPAA